MNTVDFNQTSFHNDFHVCVLLEVWNLEAAFEQVPVHCGLDGFFGFRLQLLVFARYEVGVCEAARESD